MAVENVKLNAGDNKSDVAYKIALSMWKHSNGHNPPSLENKDEFLELVRECVTVLSGIRLKT